MKQLFFLAGLPRSGSTLLGALLNQNPNLYVSHTSSFVEILWRDYSIWNEERYAEDFLGTKMKNMKIPFLQKVSQNYFSELTDKPIVLDKRRAWQALQNIKMYREIFGKNPKIICCVRKIEEIIASYKSLHLKNKKEWHPSFLQGNVFETSFIHLKRTWSSEFKTCLLLIEYKDLVEKTQATLDRIYEFINQPSFSHNLNNIRSKDPLKEAEKLYSLKGMFKLPSRIKKSTTSIKILTDEEYNSYSLKNFWKDNDTSSYSA